MLDISKADNLRTELYDRDNGFEAAKRALGPLATEIEENETSTSKV